VTVPDIVCAEGQGGGCGEVKLGSSPLLKPWVVACSCITTRLFLITRDEIPRRDSAP